MRSRRDSAGTRRVRVLLAVGTLDIGGAETQVVELATRLDRERFTVSVCCLTAAGPLAQRLERAGVPTIALGMQPFQGRLRPAAIRRALVGSVGLYRFMRETRPDVVHGVLLQAYILAAIVGRVARVRYVITSRRSLGLFKAGRPLVAPLERLANRCTDVIVANSEAVRRDTLVREHLAPRRVLVVHNGVDFSRFDRTRSTAPDLSTGTGPRVTIVGNLIHYKGHEHFLRAWPAVVARIPTATALLAGEGPMRAGLAALAQQLGVADSVRFLGTRSDVPELLAASDVYVHPSLEEGFSNAVLEAMAAGLPVIATSVGGNSEAVRDGETGLLVPPGDAPALADRMVRLLEDRAFAQRLGRAAAQDVRRRFEMSAMVRAYEDIYTRVVAGERLENDSRETRMSQCAV